MIHPKQNTSLAIVVLAALLYAGCAGIEPGNDPVVVQAERTTVMAVDVFDGFLKWEYDNRAALSALPEIKQAADRIRAQSPAWLQTARQVTKAYKVNRTEENKATVLTWTAVLRTAITQANGYLPTVMQRNLKSLD